MSQSKLLIVVGTISKFPILPDRKGSSEGRGKVGSGKQQRTKGACRRPFKTVIGKADKPEERGVLMNTLSDEGRSPTQHMTSLGGLPRRGS